MPLLQSFTRAVAVGLIAVPAPAGALAAHDRPQAPLCAINAVNDLYPTEVDTPLAVGAPGVTSNDSTPCPATVSLWSPPNFGSVSLHADGSFEYTPPPGIAVEDSFFYVIVPDVPSTGAISSTGMVTISVSGATDVVPVGTATTTTAVTNPVEPTTTTVASANPVEMTPSQTLRSTVPDPASNVLPVTR